MVGSMVVFENGRPNKKLYRKFSIDDISLQNDYACMENILSRRLKYLQDTSKLDDSFSQVPNLIFIDGGKSHVEVAKRVLLKFGLSIPTFGIVKDSKHNTRTIASSGGEVHISKVDDAFKLLVAIQDEMHRVAISYARSKHRKDSISSQLTNVKGIGEKKAIKLMLHFKTTENLKSATVDEIKAVAGVSYETAENLFRYISENVN
jgi:excinuclease ABC subunit C